MSSRFTTHICDIVNLKAATIKKIILCILVAGLFSSFLAVPHEALSIEDIPIGFDEGGTEFYQSIQGKLTLPLGFEFNRLREKATIHDALALITSVMEWGNDLWIEKTSSSWTSFWLRLKRFFGKLDANIFVMRQLAGEENYHFLQASRRWGLKPELFMGNLNTVVPGWQVLEFEYIALSKMLSMSGIPRTLLDEVDNLIQEIDSISSESDLVPGDPEVTFAKSRMKGSNYWAFYLAGLQHGLIPKRLITPVSFADRQDQIKLIIEPLSKLDVLEFANCSMNYIEQFTNDITGFTKEKKRFNESLIEHANTVYELGVR